MLKPLLSLFVLAAAGLAPAVATSPWLEDLDAARKVSATSGKPLLVLAAGSDWCIPCQVMDNEVFTRDDFLKAAPDQYVLVRLEYPRTAPLPEKLRVQNERFADQYPFDGYPAFFLFDSQGTVYGAHTGFVPGGVPGFLGLLSGMAPQKAALAALAAAVKTAAPGADRAKAEDALFRQAEAWDLGFRFSDLPLKIVQDDKDGSAGLKARYQVYNAYNRFLATWTEMPDFHKAADDLAALAVRAQSWPDLGQKILFTEGMVRLNALSDEIGARDVLRKARDLVPGSPKALQAAQLLDQLP